MVRSILLKKAFLSLLVLSGMVACVGVNATVQASESVQSLRYGTTLYYYFQDDYFNSLTELMVVQDLAQLGVHEDNAELLRGGMSLSYGMDRVAQQIFQMLLTEPAATGNTTNRDQAWFYLAQLAWQRGDVERCLTSLERMSSDYTGPLAPQANYLRASIALLAGDDQQAVRIAEQLPEDSPWLYYLYYNLGASAAAQGNWLTAIDYFRQFDHLPVFSGEQFVTEEAKSLRDKARTASGFALMAAESFDDAREEFTRIRLNGPMSDRALLGYGWASSELGNFPLALSSWQVLSEHSIVTESVRDSWLAIPYAYEQSSRPAIALAKYRLASNFYQSQLVGVNAAIKLVRDGDLAELFALGVALGDIDDTHAWIFGQALLPEGEFTPYLRTLITRDSFQVAMRELQDLYSMKSRLQDVSERLQVLTQVNTDQQASWDTVIEGDRQTILQRRQQQLRVRIDRVRQRLSRAESNELIGDRELADANKTALWGRLDRAIMASQTLESQSGQTGNTERLEFLQGLMLWQDVELYADRLWKTKRELSELDAMAYQSQVMIERVDKAITTRGQYNFGQRIADMNDRLLPHQQRLQLALVRSETQIRKLAIADLESQVEQLSRALGQSQLAIARLYDSNSRETRR